MNWHAETLSQEEVARAHKQGAAARKTFDSSLGQLRALMARDNPLEVLSRVAFSLALRLSVGETQTDPSRLEVFHLEILQALALAAPAAAARPDADYPKITQAALDLIHENGRAYRKLGRSKITRDPIANRQVEALDLVRNWTLAVRGPRHAHQTRELTREIAAEIDPTFQQVYGCRATSLYDAILGLRDQLEQRIQGHVDGARGWAQSKSPRRMLERFVERLEPEAAAKVRADLAPIAHRRRDLFIRLWNLFEGRLAEIYVLEPDDLLKGCPPPERDAIGRVFESLAYRFGELEPDALQHLHVSNPVRRRPLVRLEDGRYFCGGVVILLLELFEAFEALAQATPGLKARFERARAIWLEARLAKVVRTFLPDAQVHTRVRRQDGVDGRDGETDLVAVIDQTVLIFEAKAAKLSDAARRGALNSLKRDLGKLVVEASDQSSRLKRHIKAATGELHFATDEGELVIDAREIRGILRYNILIDDVGPLSAHWPQLRAAGIVPATAEMAPSMSVFDLETVFEILTLQSERCHYLSRRIMLEQRTGYLADESDLLAFYLQTQFDVAEAASGKGLQLYGLSTRITEHYSERRDAGALSFRIKRTTLWRDLLQLIEQQKSPGWTRFAMRLLDVGYHAQAAFERLVNDAWRAVERSPDGFSTSGLSHGVGPDRQSIAFMIGDASADQFGSNLAFACDSALAQSSAPDVLMICWFYPKTGNAYDFIGVMTPGYQNGRPAGHGFA